jgi:hypothetical protein
MFKRSKQSPTQHIHNIHRSQGERVSPGKPDRLHHHSRCDLIIGTASPEQRRVIRDEAIDSDQKSASRVSNYNHKYSKKGQDNVDNSRYKLLYDGQLSQQLLDRLQIRFIFKCTDKSTMTLDVLKTIRTRSLPGLAIPIRRGNFESLAGVDKVMANDSSSVFVLKRIQRRILLEWHIAKTGFDLDVSNAIQW